MFVLFVLGLEEVLLELDDMNSGNLPYVELAPSAVNDTDGSKIKELRLPFDVLLEILVAVALATASPSSYSR